MQIHAVPLVVEPPVKTALELLRDPRLSEGCQNVCVAATAISWGEEPDGNGERSPSSGNYIHDILRHSPQARRSRRRGLTQRRMVSKMFTDDEMAQILASAQALTNMPAEERRSAELLKQLLGGEYTPRDAAGAQGMHDFDLRLDNGKTFAVEVTTDTSSVDRAFQDQINRISPLDVPGLTRVWHVDLWTPGPSGGHDWSRRADGCPCGSVPVALFARAFRGGVPTWRRQRRR